MKLFQLISCSLKNFVQTDVSCKEKNEDRLSFYVIIRLLLSLSVGPQGKRLLGTVCTQNFSQKQIYYFVIWNFESIPMTSKSFFLHKPYAAHLQIKSIVLKSKKFAKTLAKNYCNYTSSAVAKSIIDIVWTRLEFRLIAILANNRFCVL